MALAAATAGAAAYLVFAVELYGPAVGFAAFAVVLILLGARTFLRLRHWPPGRIGFFRDRLVLLEGNTEQHIPWDRIEIATLGSATGWFSGRTQLINLTDRLTLRMARWRGPHLVTFRPAEFGLDPVSCRDLVLHARDDRQARARLPEFDSVLDLTVRPVVAGELTTPRI